MARLAGPGWTQSPPRTPKAAPEGCTHAAEGGMQPRDRDTTESQGTRADSPSQRARSTTRHAKARRGEQARTTHRDASEPALCHGLHAGAAVPRKGEWAGIPLVCRLGEGRRRAPEAALRRGHTVTRRYSGSGKSPAPEQPGFGNTIRASRWGVATRDPIARPEHGSTPG